MDPVSQGSSNLVVTSDTKYLWDGTQIAESRTADGGTVLQRFYDQGFVDSDGTNLFYTKDHLGSIRELTDGSQAIRARYDYDPYGRMTQLQGDRNSPFGYTGDFWHSPSGLDLTLFRGYDPNLGRWLSRDPLGESFGSNLYAYVTGNPVSQNDPFGLWGFGVTGGGTAEVGAVGAGAGVSVSVGGGVFWGG
jgi:RHS repeat-associated protein